MPASRIRHADRELGQTRPTPWTRTLWERNPINRRPLTRAAKGAQLVEATNRSSDALEESLGGTPSGLNEQAAFTEGEERREEAFEARIVRLDRQAAEVLFRLAGL